MGNKRCLLCGEDLSEEDFCKTCFLFLKEKYPSKKKFKKILQWYKKNAELNEED